MSVAKVVGQESSLLEITSHIVFFDRSASVREAVTPFLGRRKRTDRNVVSVRISERKLLGLSARIHVRLLFEPSDQRACPLKRPVEIIDTEEQQEAIAAFPVIGAHQ